MATTWDAYSCINTSAYLKSCYLILVKRTTSWQIAVFVNIYIDFVTLLKNIILQKIFYPSYFVIYFKDISSKYHILKESTFYFFKIEVQGSSLMFVWQFYTIIDR